MGQGVHTSGLPTSPLLSVACVTLGEGSLWLFGFLLCEQETQPDDGQGQRTFVHSRPSGVLLRSGPPDLETLELSLWGRRETWSTQ